MNLSLDEEALIEELHPLLDTSECRQGITTLTSDPFFLCFFLVSVSQGEGLGEQAVAMIGQEELAARIHDLQRQEREERGHKERTLDVARRLFPEFFESGEYRHRDSLDGQRYYLAVLEANRERLKQQGRYSRLNLYLTTTFAYEIMVMILYRAVGEGLKDSALDFGAARDVARVIDGIVAEEETHLGIVDQHNALLAGARQSLSPEAVRLLDVLDSLDAEDYRVPAEEAVRRVVEMLGNYVDGPRYRARIESGGPAAG